MVLLAALLLAAADAGSEAQREQAWRQRFRDANEKVAALQAQIDGDTAFLGDVVVGEGVSRGGKPRRGKSEYARAEARLEQNRKKLEQAKSALDDLERKASFESVPREWRR